MEGKGWWAMRRLLALFTMAAMAAGLLALPSATGAAGEQASGALIDGAGNQIGGVFLTQTSNGVMVTVTVTSATALKPGDHGIHFHTVGKCTGPDFTTAGGHFNPTSKQHGLQNTNGPHAGDMPNFTVGPSTAIAGGYRFTTMTTMVTLAPGPTSIFDDDGTALVIHADADDQRTDPAGNSGTRVACAVLLHGSTAAGSASPAGADYQARRLGS
jgi:Cu-Zn family superoxide dismutase